MDTSQLRVLVVDDDPILLEITRERLITAGHQVSVRDSPVGTAAFIQKARIDIVVLDVLMPGLRGDDLARLLKKHPATAKTAILLHSSLRSDELRPLIMSTGALGAIEKAWTSAEFHAAFARFAGRVRTLRGSSLGDPQSGSFRVGAEERESASFNPSEFSSLADSFPPAPSSRSRMTGKGGESSTNSLLEKIRSRFK